MQQDRRLNPARRRLLLSAAGLAWPALFAACSPKTPAMTPEEARRIQHLAARMRTRCIGRHLIDLPEDFVLNPVQHAEIEGVEVRIEPMSKAWFEYGLQQRTAKLKSKRIFGEETPTLRDVRPLPDGLGVVFNRSKSGASAAIRAWELRAWNAGFQVSMTVESYDKAFSKRPLPELETDVEEKFAHLMNIYRRLCGRRDDEIPQEPGDCFAHGFMAAGALDDVDITAFYHLRDTPDVFVMFSHTTKVWEDDTMLQRAASIERQYSAAGIQTLKKGPRTIHSLPYEEWLAREPATVTSACVPGHGFTLHGNETANDPRYPNIEFTLYNGHYIPSPPRSLEEKAKVPDLKRATLSEGQVLALWDAITATLRPRPGAF